MFALLVLASAVAAHERLTFVPKPEKVHLRVIEQGHVVPLTPESSQSPQEIATAFIKSVLPSETTFRVSDNYQTKHNKVTHVYLRQTVNGMDVLNGDANFNIDASGRILSAGTSFYTGPIPAAPTADQISPAILALKAIAARIGAKLAPETTAESKSPFAAVIRGSGLVVTDSIEAKAAYLQLEDGSLVLVWEMVVQTEDDWWDCAVTMDGSVEMMVNWVADGGTYNIYDPPVNDPNDGVRSIARDPEDLTPSPLGWHNQGSAGPTFTDTRGNNVYAQENWDGSSSWENNYRPDGSNSLVFDFPVDFTQQPRTYADAAITNLFYVNNLIHDIFWHYGFDEASGNFQEDNFGRGGLGRDAVQANAQDGAGYNNANFATPVDGQRPRMRMYLWNGFNPMRDGDFENSIIMHEYGHGISIRLTGGPSNVNCLSSGEGGGMGEGWGDWWGTWLLQKPQYTSETVFPMGDYVYPGGIRYFPYTTNMEINPQTYGFINGNDYGGVHAKGSVWCTTLWEVYWKMIEKHGWSSDFVNGTAGNNIILRNVVDGLKLQPCSPNFVDARDAILLADEINFGGENVCTMWEGFAKRGLGVNASSGRLNVVESFDVPAECRARAAARSA
eukprot:TRINITY_DN2540_c0_g1_i1.p2 TRINITY_DN2540_c0_g1~~TRINITY_DN2540_c0_g1_i1.p2  ORF type:complete len:616 (+),score=132.78 TRINITY_DN2540_c0_g1_i1:9-1856(+)